MRTSSSCTLACLLAVPHYRASATVFDYFLESDGLARMLKAIYTEEVSPKAPHSPTTVVFRNCLEDLRYLT